LKSSLTILFCLIHFGIFGQSQTTDIALTSDSDTIFWLTNQKEKTATFNLKSIENIKGDFVFRSWSPNSLIQIVKNDNETEGTVTFFILNSEQEYKNEIFVQEYQMPAFKAEVLYNIITSSEFNSIPSDRYIKDWEQGLDGVTYLFEQKDGKVYSFKHYWTPSSQTELTEAKLILELKEKLDYHAGLLQQWKKFQVAIPFSAYEYFGASYNVHKVLSKKELRKLKKEQRTKQKKDNEK